MTYLKFYQTAVRYRRWLINEIYSQLRTLKTHANFQDAKLFLYMIEGAIIQLLRPEKVFEYFMKGFR